MGGCCSQGSWGVWDSLEQVSGGSLPQELAWEAREKEKPHTGYGVMEQGLWTHTLPNPGSWGYGLFFP